MTSVTVAGAPHRTTAGDRVRAAVRGLGELLVTLGVVVLLFVAYEVWGTNLETAGEQADLRDELAQQWSAPAPPPVPVPVGEAPPPPALGEGVALLRVPEFGSDYGYAVVEGVTREALKKGPGHYPGTALPGEVGNLVISGHRTTYGAPFSRMGELVPGDAVVVETADAVFTYRVTGTEIVTPDAVEVTLPVPRQPGVEPTRSLLTLTTCHPRYSAQQRMIVSGELAETRPKGAGAPVAVAAG